MVRCKVCYLYPQTVLINCKQKNHIPPICSELGTLPRGSILESHLQFDIHKECIKADCISKLSVSDTDISAPINKLISNQNKKVAQRIGEFMCTIFNDAKRGTLSAWSWPSREVVDLKRKKLDVSIEFTKYLWEEQKVVEICMYLKIVHFRQYATIQLITLCHTLIYVWMYLNGMI